MAEQSLFEKRIKYLMREYDLNWGEAYREMQRQGGDPNFSNRVTALAKAEKISRDEAFTRLAREASDHEEVWRYAKKNKIPYGDAYRIVMKGKNR